VTITNSMSVNGPVQITNAPSTSLKVDAAPVKIDPAQNTVKIDSSAASPIYTQEIEVGSTTTNVNLIGYASIDQGQDGAYADIKTNTWTPGAFKVPDDKWLVIRHVSFQGDLTAPQFFKRVSLTSDEEQELVLGLAVELQGTTPYVGYFAASEDCEVYVSPGSTLAFGMTRSDDDKGGGGTIYLSGVLVDAP
jgi:hypothetical protein